MRALVLATFLAGSAAACLVDVDFEGTRFRCVEDELCPAGYACVSGVCQPADGGVDPVDAAPPDGAADAEPDEGEPARAR